MIGAATLAATGGRGVDAVLDVVGSDYLARNLDCRVPDEHLVIIGGSMAEAARAHELLEAKGTVGKVVLENR